MNYSTKILIVDDEQNIHEILENVFSHSDFGANPLILHAENGQVALNILKKNPDMDVIVLDLNMPVMNGFETITQIKADLRLQGIPVCVLSGNKHDSTKANDGQFFICPTKFPSGNAFIREFIITQTFN